MTHLCDSIKKQKYKKKKNCCKLVADRERLSFLSKDRKKLLICYGLKVKAYKPLLPKQQRSKRVYSFLLYLNIFEQCSTTCSNTAPKGLNLTLNKISWLKLSKGLKRVPVVTLW